MTKSLKNILDKFINDEFTSKRVSDLLFYSALILITLIFVRVLIVNPLIHPLIEISEDIKTTQDKIMNINYLDKTLKVLEDMSERPIDEKTSKKISKYISNIIDKSVNPILENLETK